jgi:hypothetical protein
MVAQARRMADAGWEIGEIRKILARDCGLDSPPAFETVRTWVDDDYAASRRKTYAAQKRAQRRNRGVTWLPQHAKADTKLHRMDVLHGAGLSPRSIAAVMEVDYGVQISPHAVRRYVVERATPRCLLEELKAA